MAAAQLNKGGRHSALSITEVVRMDALIAGLAFAGLTFAVGGHPAAVITNGLIAVCAAHLNEIKRTKQ